MILNKYSNDISEIKMLVFQIPKWIIGINVYIFISIITKKNLIYEVLAQTFSHNPLFLITPKYLAYTELKNTLIRIQSQRSIMTVGFPVFSVFNNRKNNMLCYYPYKFNPDPPKPYILSEFQSCRHPKHFLSQILSKSLKLFDVCKIL